MSVLDREAPAIQLESARTVIMTARETDAPAIVRYYTDNRDRFESFDPERVPIFYEERFWRAQIRQNLEDLAADRALRLFLFPRESPERVVGNIGLSNFIRGVAQSCTMGYSIDRDYEGKGMMREALRTVIDYAFGPLHFHRIEANYVPHNVRSGKLLRHLGFVVEGYSRDYLRIDGEWKDHIRAALLNPRWRNGANG